MDKYINDLDIPIPNFLDGVASLVDLSEFITHPKFLLDENTDYRSIANDWRIVGKDIYNAYVGVTHKQENNNV